MSRTSADYAELAMVVAKDLDRLEVFRQFAGPITEVTLDYGALLLAVKHLVGDIMTESNNGDELCKDLIHESFLRVLPERLWKVFGFDA